MCRRSSPIKIYYLRSQMSSRESSIDTKYVAHLIYLSIYWQLQNISFVCVWEFQTTVDGLYVSFE